MPSPNDDGMYQSDEISLADVIRFLLSWWWLIVACGGAGVLGAWLHVRDEPATFEAQTIIAMAKVPAGNVSATNDFLDVETPALLAERMSIPTTFLPSAVQACGFRSPVELMARLSIVSRNDETSAIRLAIRHSSPELAERCANAVVEMIREQQAALAKPVIERLEQSLQGIPGSAAEALPSKFSKNDSEGLGTMLAVRQLMLAVRADTGTRMLAPIYAPAEPMRSSKRRVLSSWGAAGVLLGLVIALLSTLVARFRRLSA